MIRGGSLEATNIGVSSSSSLGGGGGNDICEVDLSFF